MNASTQSLIKEDIITYNVRLGQLIDVELLNGKNERFKTPLVGVKDQRYLILEQPDIRQYGMLRDTLMDGQSIIVRTICEKTTGDCLGFRSNIMGTVDYPYRLLFIHFPDDVETHELRSEQRSEIRQVAFIYKNSRDEKIEGIITDMSKGGCRFEFPVSDDVMKLKTETMKIVLSDPNTEESREYLAKVCSQRKDQNKISVGLAFIESN